MLRISILAGLLLLPVPAFASDYCQGDLCFQKKARVNCLKPGVWDMLHKVTARIGRLEITSACDGKHARHSYHYLGQAVDFRPMQASVGAALAVLRGMSDVGGIGTYSNGLLHADIRSQRVAWHQYRAPRARFAQVRSSLARYARARQTMARYALGRQPARSAFRRVASAR